MEYRKALEIYGITTTIGVTESELKKTKRRLVKENHPDATNVSRISIDEINVAYDILLNSVNGKSNINLDSFNFIPKPKVKKTVKEMDLDTLIDYLNRDRATLREIQKESNIFIKINILLRIYDTIKNKLNEYEIEKKVLYIDETSRYSVVIETDFNIGDNGELVLNANKNIGLHLGLLRNLVVVEYSINEFFNLNFDISLIKETKQSDERQ